LLTEFPSQEDVVAIFTLEWSTDERSAELCDIAELFSKDDENLRLPSFLRNVKKEVIQNGRESISKLG
jgi:hypothetical protein